MTALSTRRAASQKAWRNRKRARSSRPEDALQRSVCELLSFYENQGKLMYFAVPNGGKRSKIEAAIMKGLGVRAGIPDLVVLIPPMEANPGIRGPRSKNKTIFLELKAGDNKLSDNQIIWRDRLTKAEFPWAEIRSVEQVQEIIKEHTSWGRAAA